MKAKVGATAIAAVVLMLTVLWSTAAGGTREASTARHAQAVTQLWGRRYDNKGGVAHAVAFAAGGSKVLVAGMPANAMHLVSYDGATGGQLSDYFYADEFGPRRGDAAALVANADGSRVYFTGGVMSAEWQHTGYDYETLAFVESGSGSGWIHRYDPGAHGDDISTAIAVAPLGARVFVTGYSTNAAGNFDYATVAINASTGKRIWARRYSGAAGGDDRPTAIAVSHDGSAVYVTGESVGTAGTHDYETIAYDAGNGAQLWQRRYDGPAGGEDVPRAIAASPDGSAVYVTGSVTNTTGGTNNDDFGTIAYDAATGATRWVAIYSGEAATGADDARAIAVSPNGTKIFVTGPSSNGANLDYTTIAYGTHGGVVWLNRYNGPADLDDVSNALAVSHDGSQVFVTGGSQNGASSGEDYATIGIGSTTGRQLWHRRNNGAGGPAEASAIAVSPDGSKLVVTGKSAQSPGGTTDWSTLVYSTG